MIDRPEKSREQKRHGSGKRLARMMDVRGKRQGFTALLAVMAAMIVVLAGCASSGGVGDTTAAGAEGSSAASGITSSMEESDAANGITSSNIKDTDAASGIAGSSIEDNDAADSSTAGGMNDSETIGWEPIPQDDPARQREDTKEESGTEQAEAGTSDDTLAEENAGDSSQRHSSQANSQGTMATEDAGNQTTAQDAAGNQSTAQGAAGNESSTQGATASQSTVQGAAGNQGTTQGTAESQGTTQGTAANPSNTVVQGNVGVSSDAALVSLMQTFMDNYGLNASNFAVAYKNLSTGTTYYFNELKQWDACSTYKLPLNLLYYDMQAAGEITADTIIPGTNTPLSECHHQSLEFSNNPLSEAMMNNLGSYDKVKQQMRKYFTLTDAETDSSYYHHNYFCARQMMDCAQYLYDHQSEYQEALGYLEAAQPGQYFRRYLPSDVTIAQKYGLRDGYNHNAGIIFGSTPFVLSVYSYQAGGDEMIARCAEALYQYTES